VYDTWTVQYLAWHSSKDTFTCYANTEILYIFKIRHIYLHWTQSFAAHEISTSVIFTNNKRVGSSNYLIVRSARKPCFHIWHKRVPNFLIWHKRVPQIFYRSRYAWCYKIPPARNDLNRSRGTEPRQLIGLASDNAHFNPTLSLLVKITDVNISWAAKAWVLM
jgi:hypothetical protein